jgi:hypothetical protein
MTAMHWMQIAALTSPLGLAGTAVAIDTDGTTSTDNGISASSPGIDTPSSGAIVTPDDKAMGLGKDHEHAGNRNGDVTPRYGMPTTPGVTDRDSTSTLDENESGPARTGSDVQPGDMGPGNVRGE